MRIEEKLCFNSNATTCIEKRFCVQEFWYIVSGHDIQPEQSENDIVTTILQKAVAGCEIRRVIYHFL